jgi:YidC/Oxa1 family membrane protein insertase
MVFGGTRSIAAVAMRSTLSSGKKIMSRGNYRPPIRTSSFRVFSAWSFTKVSTEDVPTGILEAVSGLRPHSYSDLIEGINQIESKTEFDYSPTHLVMEAVEQIHLFAGIPYWEAIIISTLALRVLLVPSAIIVIRDVSKMRALQPEIKKIKESFAGVSAAEDPTIRFKYGAEVTKLFKANNVNPLRSSAISFLQLPIFLSLFFGLRNMGTFYPEYSSGGELWFTDLSAADPYFILPSINALSFLLMIELGSEGPQTEQQKVLKMVQYCICLKLISRILDGVM